MRTKHLLYTMALASVFAACTQDEFETVKGADALAGRKSIGQVTFTEAPSTRWNVENFNTIKPEEDNGYSLLLVDVPRQGLDGQHVYPIDNYELVNEVQTNYVFKYNNGEWTNDAMLVEGNYLFVAPAQENKMDRKTVEITLPTEQNLSLGADGKLDPLSAIKEFAKSGYPFYIGHRFLSEGGVMENPAMRNIFAFPEITVKNTNRDAQQKPVLTKVILKRPNPEHPFVINATVDTKKAAELLTNEWFEAAGEDTKGQLVVGGWAGHMSKTFGETIPEGMTEKIEQGSNPDGTPVEIPENVNWEVTYLTDGDNEKYYAYDNGLYGWTSDLLSTPKSTSQFIVINMPEGGIELGYKESISFNAIIPAEKYVMNSLAETGDLEIYAVLENKEAWQKVMVSNTNVDMHPGKRYPEQDYEGLNVKGGKGWYFTIDLNEKSSDGLCKYVQKSEAEVLGGVTTVKTTADLVAAIKANSSTENLNITIEGRNVVYNNEVNNAVARTTCQDVNIQGYIKVEGSDDAKKPLIIDPRVTIEQVVIEKGNVQAGATNLKSVFIAKDGALNLTKVLVNGAEAGNAVIDNAGTLTLSTTKFAKVNNYNVLKVNENLEGIPTSYSRDAVEGIANLYAACGEGGEIISPSIDLKPSVEVLADGTYAISGELNYPITVNAWTKADKSDAGVLKLSDDASIVKVIEKFGNKEVEKIGNIINNGKIIGDHSLTVDAGRTMTVGTEATVEGKVIISAATEKLANMTQGIAEYEPAAVVYNAGTLKNVEVNGLLKMMNANAHVDGEVSNTATNSDKGEIDNSVKGVIAKKMTEENVVVFATIDKIDLDDHENTVKALKDYTTPTRQVTVFRLIGELKRVQSMENGKEVELTNDHVGEAVTAIEFMAGSSITLGEVKVKSGIKFIARAKDVLVKGRTFDTSILKATTEQGYRYLGKIEGMYKSEQGSFKYDNSTKKSKN